MNIYLLPKVVDARGSVVPQGVDQLGALPYDSLDLTDNACIVGTNGLIDVSGIGNGRLLASGLDATIGLATRTFLRNRLGLAAGEDESNPRALLRTLLTLRGREDGTRWRNVTPYRVGRYHVHEIWLLNELVWRQVDPIVSGGATHTDNFDTGDSGTMGATLTWNENTGTWDNNTNQGRQTGTGGSGAGFYARAEHDSLTVDQTVAAKCYNVADVAGVCARFASGANTFYRANIWASNNRLELKRTVAGTQTDITFAAATYVSGQEVKLIVKGSTLQGYYNGVLVVTTTDTNITTGTRGGLASGGSTAQFDDFTFGDYEDAAAYLIGVSTQQANTTSPLTPTLVPTPSTGDLVIVWCTSRNETGTMAPPGSEGWETGENPSQTGLEDIYFAKIWGLGATDDTTPSFTNTTPGSGWGVTAVVIRNPLHATTPWDCAISGGSSPAIAADGSQTNASSTSMGSPSVSVAVNHATVLRYFGSADDNAHASPSEGVLAYGGASYDSTQGSDFGQSVSILEDTNIASSTGTATMTQGAVGPDISNGITIVLQVPSSGTNANAGHSAGTGAANTAQSSIQPSGGHASGTGAAGAATSKIAASAGQASGTGVANDATVTTGTAAIAGHAAGTGTAHDPQAAVAPSGGHALGTGEAHDATATTGTAASAGHAAGTGSAHNATTATLTAAGHAAGVGSAPDATAEITVGWTAPTGSGEAFDATVTTDGASTVNAGHASGTGTAFDATASGTTPVAESFVVGGRGSRDDEELRALLEREDEEILLLLA